MNTRQFLIIIKAFVVYAARHQGRCRTQASSSRAATISWTPRGACALIELAEDVLSIVLPPWDAALQAEFDTLADVTARHRMIDFMSETIAATYTLGARSRRRVRRGRRNTDGAEINCVY